MTNGCASQEILKITDQKRIHRWQICVLHQKKKRSLVALVYIYMFWKQTWSYINTWVNASTSLCRIKKNKKTIMNKRFKCKVVVSIDGLIKIQEKHAWQQYSWGFSCMQKVSNERIQRLNFMKKFNCNEHIKFLKLMKKYKYHVYACPFAPTYNCNGTIFNTRQ